MGACQTKAGIRVKEPEFVWRVGLHQTNVNRYGTSGGCKTLLGSGKQRGKTSHENTAVGHAPAKELAVAGTVCEPAEDSALAKMVQMVQRQELQDERMAQLQEQCQEMRQLQERMAQELQEERMAVANSRPATSTQAASATTEATVPNVQEKQTQRGEANTCRKYDGFIEHAYRLVFAFEERFNCKPELKTILPTGTIENEKILEPEEERALTCFAYAQDITADAAQQFLETPFVWQRDNGTFGLVQTWPVRFNDKFKKDFTYVKYPQNPDDSHFAPQAMEEFKKTVFNMFGEHKDPPLYFCHKRTQNSKSVYMGRGSALLDMLRTNDVIRKEFDIVDILEPDGFKSRWVNGKQEEGEKEFHMTLDEEYALYTKQGWETMACVKLWHQFDSEVTIGQQVEFAPDRTRCAGEAAF